MHLTKHHGLGNDFLVLVDPAGEQVVSPDMARALCDRHRGIGADGFIHVTAGAADAYVTAGAAGADVTAGAAGADVTMVLFNADGSRAEMSGNGVRCLGQAVVQAGLADGPRLVVATDAGMRTLDIEAGTTPRTHEVTVDMGPVDDHGDDPDWLGGGVAAAARASMGNPHLVLFTPDPGTAPDVVEIGHLANDRTPGGTNVEVISIGTERDELRLDVFERGVGRTLACGTGACAAAAVAHRWGLVGPRVAVRMPGGTAEVTLRDDTILLGGPTVSIGLVECPWPVIDGTS